MERAGTIDPSAAAPGRARGRVQRLGEAVRRLVAAIAAFAYLWTCRRVGARARALGRPLLRNAGRIEIGADVLLDSRAARVELAALGRGRLIVGHGVSIGPGSRVNAACYVEIGDRVHVGARCLVSDETARPAWEEAAIWIGDAVVLGDGVTVAPGTVIGAGAVIAAGCAVSGVIPPFALVSGVGAGEVAQSVSPVRNVRPAAQPSSSESAAHLA